MEVRTPPWLTRLDSELLVDDPNPRWRDKSDVRRDSRRVKTPHGNFVLPDGYEWMVVPTHVQVFPPPALESIDSSTVIATSSNLAGTVLGLYQVLHGTWSLYMARGDQIKLYGFSAFGLCVLLFLPMTVFNLVVQLFTEDYPEFYMVQSAEMLEAQAWQRGGFFEGTVGTTLVDDSLSEAHQSVLRGPAYTGDWKISPMEPCATQAGTQDFECTLARVATGSSSSTNPTRFRARFGQAQAAPSSNDWPKPAFWIPCCSLPLLDLPSTAKLQGQLRLRMATGIGIAMLTIHIVTVGCLGGFTFGTETADWQRSERVFIFVWFSAAYISSPLCYLSGKRDWSWIGYGALTTFVGGFAAIGMSQVCYQMWKYGTCDRIEW